MDGVSYMTGDGRSDMAGESRNVTASLEEEQQREHGTTARRQLGETSDDRRAQRLQRRLQVAQQHLQPLEKRLRRSRSQGGRSPQRPQRSRQRQEHSVGEESSQVFRRCESLHQTPIGLGGRRVHEMAGEASD